MIRPVRSFKSIIFRHQLRTLIALDREGGLDVTALHALSLDVSRLPDTKVIILPLAVVGWTLREQCLAYTLDDTTFIYAITAGTYTPGTVLISVQIFSPNLVGVVDWCSLLMLP